MAKMTRSEVGRLGAAARAKKLGPGGMAEVGRKGGEATKARHGLEHYRAIAPEGGTRTRELHPGLASEAGKKGGARTRELVRLAREAGGE